MNLTYWIRQMHRWVSLLFTAAFLANGILVLRGKYDPVVGIAAVVPLVLLLLMGLYLFALPYVARAKPGSIRSRP